MNSVRDLRNHLNNHKKAAILPHPVPCRQNDCSKSYPDVWRFIRHFRKKHSVDFNALAPNDLGEAVNGHEDSEFETVASQDNERYMS